MEKFKVIVTFQDQTKKIPLVVTPSTELGKFQSEEAYKHFRRTVRSVFALPTSASFTFYEKSSREELTSESFVSDQFSKRWTLVVEGMDELANGIGDSSPPSTVKVAPTPGNSTGFDLTGLVNGYDDSSLSCFVDSGREVVMSKVNGGFGCILRYFIIQEDYSGDEGKSGSGVSANTGESGDILTTLFVVRVQKGGPADRSRVKKGDKVFSINGERITSADYSSITSLIQSAGEEMALLLTPKSDDVLQLSGFAAIAYGEEGEYDTKRGHAVVQDIDLMCSEIPSQSAHHYHGSGSGRQSNDSYSHRVIATTTSLDTVEEGSGRGDHVYHQQSKDDVHRPGSSSSHDDILITSRLEDFPISPQPQKTPHKKPVSPWVISEEVNQLMTDNVESDVPGNHQRQHSGLSTDSDQPIGPLHVRQMSGFSTDSGDYCSAPRRLSNNGKLFTDQELVQIGSSTTLPSASTLPSGTSSRIWSDSQFHEESTSPTPEMEQMLPGGEVKRKSSIRKPSLEDLTRVDVKSDNRTLSPQKMGVALTGSQGDGTTKPQSLSQDSAGSDDLGKRRYSSQREKYKGRHRPSMVLALEQGPLLELTAKAHRGGGRKSSTEKRHSRMAGDVILESDEPALRSTIGGRSYSFDGSGMMRRGHRSQSLEQLDELGDDDTTGGHTQPHLQSQPEVGLLRTKSTRPHSAGVGGRLSLRYAEYFGPLSKKIEKDETGKKSKTKNYFAVLKGTKMFFYKDQEDAEAGGQGHGEPIELVGANVGIPEDYHKKRNVFRIVMPSGTGILFQADSDESVRKWLDLIRSKTGVENTATPGLSVDNFLDISSQYTKNGSRRGSGREEGGTNIFGKLKKKHFKSSSEDSTLTFGVALEQCPKSASNQHLPKVIELCTSEIETRGLECKGLYRTQGNEAVVSLLISEMNKGNFDAAAITEDWGDITVVTTLLKRFLKQLPDSLIPGNMYSHFIMAARSPSNEGCVNRMKELIGQLNPTHYHTLHHIVKHFGKIVNHSEHNLMTASNLAIVFSPTFLRGPNNEAILKDMEPGCKLIEMLIAHTDELFDQESPQVPQVPQHQPLIQPRRSISDQVLSEESGLNNSMGSKGSKIPGLKRNTSSSSSLDSRQTVLVGKVSKNQRTQEWVLESDFQGSQEEPDDSTSGNSRRIPGSMWAGGNKPHQKRRLSQSNRSLNPENSPRFNSQSSQPVPSIRKDPNISRSHTIDDRQVTKLKRKQSYAVAMGTGSLGPSFGSHLPNVRERSRSTGGEERSDNDVLKDFLGSAREPPDRMVYSFVSREQPNTSEERRNSNTSNGSPFQTYQESFL